MDFGVARDDYWRATAYNLPVPGTEASSVNKENSGIVREVSNCRVCGCSDLVTYLDLGLLLLANNLAATASDAKAMRRYPMQVQYCRDGSLPQLTVVIDAR